MKISNYIIIALIFLFTACKKKAPTEYQINGFIEGVENGTKVEMHLQLSDFFLGEHKKVIDSTTIIDGKFTFSGNLKFPQLYQIIINEPQKERFEKATIPIFLENSNIKISAKLDDISSRGDIFNGAYNYNSVTIEGSEINNKYVQFSNDYNKIKLKENELWDENLKNFKEKRKLSISEGINFSNRFEAVWKEKNEYLFNYVKSNINSTLGQYVGFYSMQVNARFTKNQLNEIKSIIPENINEFIGLNVLKENISAAEKIAPGSKYTDLPFNDKDGNPVKLSDYVGKGKYILLEFWASWCGPCRMDIPHLKDIYKLYGEENFDIISVSLDKKNEEWLKAIDEEKMEWLQVSDGEGFTGDLANKYQIKGIPACFLIDPNGIIVTDNMRGSYMDKRLIEMYGNKFGDKF